jgi:hypothetical protein
VRPRARGGERRAFALWRLGTRDRLWSVDPRMAAIVASLFEFDLVA